MYVVLAVGESLNNDLCTWQSEGLVLRMRQGQQVKGSNGMHKSEARPGASCCQGTQGRKVWEHPDPDAHHGALTFRLLRRSLPRKG